MAGYIAQSMLLDWMTPPSEVEQVIVPIIGVPNLDPSSHPAAYVPSRVRFFGHAREDDGFLQNWHELGATAFLNPTYGETWPKQMGPKPATWRPCSRWVEKCGVEAARGMTVLALLPAHTDRRWFHRYIARCDAFCLLEKRVKFVRAGHGLETQAKSQPGGGHMYALWAGHDRERYLDAFDRVLSPRGLVVTPAR